MHEKHKKGGEEEKAQAFEVQNWMRASQQRTEEFLKSGPRSPATWVLANPHMGFMHDALQGGESNGVPWFIARAPHAVSHHAYLCLPPALYSNPHSSREESVRNIQLNITLQRTNYLASLATGIFSSPFRFFAWIIH